MLIDSNIRDQAYQFFIQEALEFLQTLEEGLLNLQNEHDTPQIHALMRAAHSIKGGAASVGLEAIKKIAHQMEDVLRALYKDGVVIDAELEELLLQAYDCLRTPLIQQIQTGESNAEHWLEQSESIFAQLVEKLGDAMFGESELPTAAELGIDIVMVIFSGDVEEGLQRLEAVLADENHPEVAGELRAQSQVFLGMGELANMPGFVALAKAAEAAIDRHPEKAREITTIALRDLRAGQAAVLAGDRVQGGEVSPELAALASGDVATAPTENHSTENFLTKGDFTAEDFSDTDDSWTFAVAPTSIPSDITSSEIVTPEIATPEIKTSDIETSSVTSEVILNDAFALFDDMDDDDDAPLAAEDITIENTRIEDVRETVAPEYEIAVDEPVQSLESQHISAINQELTASFRNDVSFDDEADEDDEFDVDPNVNIFLTSDFSDVDEELSAPNNIEPNNIELTNAIANTETIIEQWDNTLSDAIVQAPVVINVEQLPESPVTQPLEQPPVTQPPEQTLEQSSAIIDLFSTVDVDDIDDVNIADTITLDRNSAVIETPPKSDVPEAIAPPVAEVKLPPCQPSIQSAAANPQPVSSTSVNDIPAASPVSLTSSKSLSESPSESPSKSSNKAASNADTPVLSSAIRVDLSRLERLNNLVGEMVSQENSAILQNQQVKDIVNTVLQRVSRFDRLTRELLTFMDGSQTARSHLRYQSTQTADPSLSSEFDPLQMDDYSDLSVLMQETIDEIAQIGEAMRDMTLLSQQSQQTQRQKQQTLRQVRNDLLWARMLPIGDILQRFPRMVRDMSNKYSKSVAVKLTGTNTLVDKAMLEKLYDPIVHLVRNGFDHGIESPEEREALGKPKEANLEIRAFHRGSQIYIEVVDDGRGIDTAKVLKKAISKGLITAEEGETLTREQIYDLLFAPGFSTTDIVSDLSGRGVGLDTVRSQVKSLKGSLSIKSELNKGTIFTLRLPLTLTITKLLVFSIKGKLMSVPVNSLRAIVAAPTDQIQTLKNGQFYHWQEQFIPIYHQAIFAKHYSLDKITREQPHALTLPTKGKVPLLLLAGDTQTIALPVDTILYEQELAIKPFGKAIAPPPYLYGCTLLGNGSLVPVIDTQMLITHKQNEIVQREVAPKLPTAPKIEIGNATILVVDDSLTTRQTLASVLQKAGYRTLQARDGREAVDQLAQSPEIQAIFCDIEMPRMNGFEFLNACRQEYSKDILPVIMLSSRSNEKHRQVAKYMGANEYLTKPFMEPELLSTLKTLLLARSKNITDGIVTAPIVESANPVLVAQ